MAKRRTFAQAPGAIRHCLTEGLESIGLSLDEIAIEGLGNYLRLLERWNRKFNLTGVRDPLDMVPRHVLDSLVVRQRLRGDRALDVGSGAGVPGMVLAIVNPNRHWTLLDSNAKKTRFLLQAKSELGLSNVTVVTGRADGDEISGETFDCVISRAFGSVPELWRLARPLLASDGCLLCMKGHSDEDFGLSELDPSPRQTEVISLQVPGADARTLVQIDR